MRNRKVRETAAEVDLTPMLDVVFILLIFFIVTAVFIQEEVIELEVPPSGPSQATLPTILVEVEEDGLVRVNGRASLVTSVRANIERLRAESPQSAVIIQAHPLALNGTILKVRDQIAGANVEQVNLILSDI